MSNVFCHAKCDHAKKSPDYYLRMDKHPGHYIREWREYRHLSLRRLVNRLEGSPGGEPLISHASLGRIEQGKQPYSQPILEALAAALNCTVSDLLEVNPLKEGDVVDLMHELKKLDAGKQKQAMEYLQFLARKETA